MRGLCLGGTRLGCTNSEMISCKFVAGMIFGQMSFWFWRPDSGISQCCSCGAVRSASQIRDQYPVIPMIGTAPLSSIYALRVFGPVGGAPASRILAAMTVSLTALEGGSTPGGGQSGGVNVKVCNMRFWWNHP